MNKPAILQKEELKEELYRAINESGADITIIQSAVAEIYMNVNDVYRQMLQAAKEREMEGKNENSQANS